MRKIWVRIVAAGSGLIVVLLALAFARLQNPPLATPPIAPSLTAASARVEPGRVVFDAQGCARCHAVAGKGNPRSPLDGVGARRDAAALRDWTLATGSAETKLSARAANIKQTYRELPTAELDALIAYLQSLRAPAHDPSSTEKPG